MKQGRELRLQFVLNQFYKAEVEPSRSSIAGRVQNYLHNTSTVKPKAYELSQGIAEPSVPPTQASRPPSLQVFPGILYNQS